MNPRRALAISLLVLLGACGSSGQQNTARLLNDRLQTQMASDIAGNRAIVQSVPGGSRVVLLETSMFPTDADALDGRRYDVRANLVGALLDPELMRIQVADTAALSARQREARVRNTVQFLVDYGLGSTLIAADATQGDPAGLAVTITVQCPGREDRSGYNNGLRTPGCS